MEGRFLPDVKIAILRNSETDLNLIIVEHRNYLIQIERK